jgi:hypothetical protein
MFWLVPIWPSTERIQKRETGKQFTGLPRIVIFSIRFNELAIPNFVRINEQDLDLSRVTLEIRPKIEIRASAECSRMCRSGAISVAWGRGSRGRNFAGGARSGCERRILSPPPGRFNFDQIGTEVGEDKAAGRTHHHVAEFADPETIEGAWRTAHVVLLSPA